MKTGICVCMGLVMLFPATLAAQDVVGWRTNGTGLYPDANPPVRWSKTENVLWATPLPDRSNAQPVVVNDKIFLCAEPFTLMCLSASDGNILWERSNSYRDVKTEAEWIEIEKELAVADPLRAQKEELRDQIAELQKQLGNDESGEVAKTLAVRQAEVDELDELLRPLTLAAKFTLPKTQRQYNGYTTATPTSDGEYVWTVFGNRVVVCYDMQGNRQWSHVLSDNPQAMWGHTSSPLLAGDRLIVNMEQIYALDAKTGEQIWRTKYGQTWGSAVQTTVAGERLVLLSNGRILRASDGEVLTRVAPLGNASPVVYDGSAYYIGARAAAFDFPNRVDKPLELVERELAKPNGNQVFASPIVWDGLIYTASTRQVLSVIDAKTGERVYAQRLDLGSGPLWASFCLAGKYLYVSSRDGTTLVLRPGRVYKEIQRNTLDFFIATPVFAGDRMYVRTNDHLYCIRES